MLFKTHMTQCQIMLLDLAAVLLIFFFLHFTYFIPAQESRLINSRAVLHTPLHAHSDRTVCVYVCVCRYKCMLIALLVFSFMLPPLLSCENLSVCASISPFLSAFSALQHSPFVPYPAASCVWPTESFLSFCQTPFAAETVKRPLQ